MSIEAALGGHWERLVDYTADENLSNGYTQEFKIDGSKFKMARFALMFVGQTLNININSTARMWGAINFNKHDGTGTYKHPANINNSRYNLLSRGTGELHGFLIPKISTDSGYGYGWLMNFYGYSALDSAGGWAAAGGDYWRIDGRIFIANQTTLSAAWDMRYGFSGDGSGSANLTVEGMRG